MVGLQQRSTLRELLSPGPSLETEDDEDEDFEVEEEAQHADDEDDEGSSSEEEEGGDEGTAGASHARSHSRAVGDTATAGADSVSGLRSGVQHSTAGGAGAMQDEACRRLQALGAALGNDDDVVFEEEILSDSDISQLFPEEDADAEALLLGASDSSDEEFASDGEEAEDGSAGSQQHAAGAAAQPAAGDADAAAMPPPPPRPRAGAAAGEAGNVGCAAGLGHGAQGPGAVHQQPAAPPRAGGAPEQQAGLGATDAAAFPADDPYGFAAAEADMHAFGAHLGTLEDNIAHRTRANHSLAEVSIEDLEQLLQADDELEGLGLDDEAEYQRFLQSLRVGEGGPEGGATFSFLNDDAEDSDDGDFYQELRAMLGDGGDGAAAGRGQAEQGGGRRRKERQPRAAKPRAPKPPRWTRGAAGERTIESVAALREHRLRPLAPKPFITDLARLTTLAAAAAGQPDLRPPVAVDTIMGPMLVPAAAVAGPPLPPLPPGIRRAPVAWQPPLPAALRKYLPAEAAAAVPGGGRQAPLPVGAPPVEGAEVQPAAFQPRQYRQLYGLIHQHAQLLMQVYLMAACSQNPAHAAVAQQAREMADAFRQHVRQQAADRQAQGIAPYNPEALGFSDRLPPLPPSDEGGKGDGRRAGRRSTRAQRELEQRQRLDAAQAAWRPWCSTAVFTVADVAPLRWMQHVVDGVPPPQPPTAAAQLQQQQQQAMGQGEGQPCAGGQLTEQQARQPRGQEQQPPNQQRAEEQRARRGQLPGGQQREGQGRELSSDEDMPDRRRKRRRTRPAEGLRHPLWSSLPPGAAAVVADVQPVLEPALLPRAPDHLSTVQQLFTPAEDELLALGIHRFGYDWARIRAELLPTKSESQLFFRKKNRVAGNAPENCVKDVVSTITGELQADEVALLEKATVYYGRQPHRWDIICREHLPHRQPQVLATLWKVHRSGGVAAQPSQDSGAARRARKRQRLAGAQPQRADGAGGDPVGGEDGQQAVWRGEGDGQQQQAVEQREQRHPQQRRAPNRGQQHEALAPGPTPVVRSMFLAGDDAGGQSGPKPALAQQQQDDPPQMPLLLLQQGQGGGWAAGSPQRVGQPERGGGGGDGAVGAAPRGLLPTEQQLQQQVCGLQEAGDGAGPAPVFVCEELADSDEEGGGVLAAPPDAAAAVLPDAAVHAGRTGAAALGPMQALLLGSEPSEADPAPAAPALSLQQQPEQRGDAAGGNVHPLGREELVDVQEEGLVDGGLQAAAQPAAPAPAAQLRQPPLEGRQPGWEPVADEPAAAAELGVKEPVRRSTRAAAKRQHEGAEPGAGEGEGGGPGAPPQQPAAKRRNAKKPHQAKGAAAPAALLVPVFEQEELPDSDEEGAAPPAAVPGATQPDAMLRAAHVPAGGQPSQLGGEHVPASSLGQQAALQAAAADQQPPDVAPAQQPVTWGVDEEKLLLRTLLKAGGQLSAEQLSDLAEQVGGAAQGRTADVVAQHCLTLMQRYRETQLRKRAAAAQQQG